MDAIADCARCKARFMDGPSFPGGPTKIREQIERWHGDGHPPVISGGEPLHADLCFVRGELWAAPIGSPPYSECPDVWVPAKIEDGELTVNPYS